MFELRRNSDQNPLSKVGQRTKQYLDDLSRDFSIMLSSVRPRAGRRRRREMERLGRG